MIKIYCIIDINGLRYVGSTKFKLYERLSKHRWTKNNKKSGSCSQLDLDNCKIILLEECDENIRYERERYWYDRIDCVNKHIPNRSKKEYTLTIKEQKRIYDKNLREYQKSWGNLLSIDLSAFKS